MCSNPPPEALTPRSKRLVDHEPALVCAAAGRADGFSLIEVMVVVVIIGMLAGAVALGVNGYMDTARKNRVKSDIATIVDAVEAYNLEKGRYPTNDEGLDNLPLDRGYLDPWGHPYEYNSPGAEDQPFEIVGYGADGVEGGEGADADFYSWQLGEVEDDQAL